jgi:hypothetical protein
MTDQLILHCRIDQAEALRRGYACGANASIAIPSDLGPEDRELIAASLITINGGPALDGNPTLPEPTVAGIVEALRKRAAQKAEREAAAEAARLRKRHETIAAIRDRTETKSVETVYSRTLDAAVYSSGTRYHVVRYTRVWPDVSTMDLAADDPLREEIAAWREDCERRNAVAKAEAEAEAERLAQESEAQIAARRAKREAWIAEHGSARLRRLVQEGIEYRAVYRDERLALERPGWQWLAIPESDLAEPRNAPEAALALLDEARASVPEGTTVALHYYRTERQEPNPDYDSDYDPPSEDYDTGYVVTGKFLGRDIMYRRTIDTHE